MSKDVASGGEYYNTTRVWHHGWLPERKRTSSQPATSANDDEGTVFTEGSYDGVNEIILA